MANYKVTLLTDLETLPALLETVKPSAKIISVVADDSETGEKPKKKMQYAGGRRNKGISGEDLALSIFKEAKKAGQQFVLGSVIEKQFVARGFAPTSATSTLSLLVRAQKVRRLGDDKYTLEPVT
jgi:hypothetical protein